MKREDSSENLIFGVGPGSEIGLRTTILAVGDVDEWTRHRGSLPVSGKLAFSSFEGITQELFQIINPEVVFSPILARGFDCIDLAQVLSSIGYPGRYRAIAAALPDPDIVKREIRSMCPGLDFDVIILDDEAAYNN